uniref:NADH dehydrogenase subunit 2 n=1 Tax=Cladotaenia vulturi TaxID=1917734 RepID=A0A1J0I303_9CEST|nr:NADH dehydrogenase subunit 2 [Cladotaenia vulturi]APC62896.1 NADH dehydrogenase subunit 2 [Cladotaenia vulturi]
MFIRFYIDVVAFSLVFSILFCVCCSFVDSLLGLWVFMELGGLSIVPVFFYIDGLSLYGFYSSLLSYIVMSSLSSVFIISGFLFYNLYYFVFWGFAVKFGLFPFMFWVYQVFNNSNWNFIFCLSIIMKFPILFFCFLLQSDYLFIVYVDCFFTILTCSFLIWFFSCNWTNIWGHISLVSVATLMVVCFCSDVWLCYFVYIYYFLWGTLCIVYFSVVDDYEELNNYFWVFCFLLLVTPVSLPLFYKLSVCLCIVHSSFYLLFSWCLYSFSEQFFLYKLASNILYSEVFNDWFK